MAFYKTRWPIFEFYLVIWKFSIKTQLMNNSLESLTYEYIRLAFLWKNDYIFHIRLYTTMEKQLINHKETK